MGGQGDGADAEYDLGVPARAAVMNMRGSRAEVRSKDTELVAPKGVSGLSHQQEPSIHSWAVLKYMVMQAKRPLANAHTPTPHTYTYVTQHIDSKTYTHAHPTDHTCTHHTCHTAHRIIHIHTCTPHRPYMYTPHIHHTTQRIIHIYRHTHPTATHVHTAQQTAP